MFWVSALRSDKRLMLETSAFKLFRWPIYSVEYNKIFFVMWLSPTNIWTGCDMIKEIMYLSNNHTMY